MKQENINTGWTLEVKEDPNNPEECILEFPPELLDRAGWKEGDTLEWIDNKDGTWGLQKVKK